jgi:hypothetical protein
MTIAWQVIIRIVLIHGCLPQRSDVDTEVQQLYPLIALVLEIVTAVSVARGDLKEYKAWFIRVVFMDCRLR